MLAFRVMGSFYGACLSLSETWRFGLDYGFVLSLTGVHLEADARQASGHNRRHVLPFCPLHQECAQCSSFYHDVCSDTARVASSSVSKDDGGPNMSNVCINGRTQEGVPHCVSSRPKHGPHPVCPQHAHTHAHRLPQALVSKPWRVMTRPSFW